MKSALLAAVLAVAAFPAGTHAAEPLAARLAVATFLGTASVSPASSSSAATIDGEARNCSLTLFPAGRSPQTVACRFTFGITPAAVSTRCSGAWVHTSSLIFTDPATAQTVVITYEPTVTAVSEGEGAGTGYNALHVSKVHFVIATLCSPQGGTLVGSASGPY